MSQRKQAHADTQRLCACRLPLTVRLLEQLSTRVDGLATVLARVVSVAFSRLLDICLWSLCNHPGHFARPQQLCSGLPLSRLADHRRAMLITVACHCDVFGML